MKNKAVKVIRYEKEVYCNEDMDFLRRKECLCMNCSTTECLIAKKGYELCKEHNIAFMVTRCPNFKEMV